jgi:hypothetical protein
MKFLNFHLIVELFGLFTGVWSDSANLRNSTSSQIRFCVNRKSSRLIRPKAVAIFSQFALNFSREPRNLRSFARFRCKPLMVATMQCPESIFEWIVGGETLTRSFLDLYVHNEELNFLRLTVLLCLGTH